MTGAQTEEHIEKQEKYLDQMDKKKKSVNDQIAKGEKILADPKSPKFLDTHVEKLKSLWIETNKESENRLHALRGKKRPQGTIIAQLFNDFVSVPQRTCPLGSAMSPRGTI